MAALSKVCATCELTLANSAFNTNDGGNENSGLPMQVFDDKDGCSSKTLAMKIGKALDDVDVDARMTNMPKRFGTCLK